MIHYDLQESKEIKIRNTSYGLIRKQRTQKL